MCFKRLVCGRPVFIADGKYGQHRFAYNAAGRRTSLTDAQGNTHGFVYDGSGLLCERHYQGVIGAVTGAVGGGIAKSLELGASTVAAAFTTKIGSSGLKIADMLGGSTAGNVVRYASARIGSSIKATENFSPKLSQIGIDVVSDASTGALSQGSSYLTSEGKHTPLGLIQSIGSGAFWGAATAGVGGRAKQSSWMPKYVSEATAETSVLKKLGRVYLH